MNCSNAKCIIINICYDVVKNDYNEVGVVYVQKV